MKSSVRLGLESLEGKSVPSASSLVSPDVSDTQSRVMHVMQTDGPVETDTAINVQADRQATRASAELLDNVGVIYNTHSDQRSQYMAALNGSESVENQAGMVELPIQGNPEAEGEMWVKVTVNDDYSVTIVSAHTKEPLLLKAHQEGEAEMVQLLNESGAVIAYGEAKPGQTITLVEGEVASEEEGISEERIEEIMKALEEAKLDFENKDALLAGAEFVEFNEKAQEKYREALDTFAEQQLEHAEHEFHVKLHAHGIHVPHDHAHKDHPHDPHYHKEEQEEHEEELLDVVFDPVSRKLKMENKSHEELDVTVVPEKGKKEIVHATDRTNVVEVPKAVESVQIIVKKDGKVIATGEVVTNGKEQTLHIKAEHHKEGAHQTGHLSDDGEEESPIEESSVKSFFKKMFAGFALVGGAIVPRSPKTQEKKRSQL